MELKKPVVIFFKTSLFKIISLILISILYFVLFNIEAKIVIPDSHKYMWPQNIRWSLLITPVLFFTWLFLICGLNLSAKNFCITIISYLIWFILSYDLWLSLIASVNAFPFAGFFNIILLKIIYFFENILKISNNESFTYTYIYVHIIFVFILLYSLLIFENLFLKKFFNFVYSKTDYIFLFTYPVFICVLSFILYLFVGPVEELFEPFLRRHFLELHRYFYSGVVIAAYMITQGLFFVKLTYKKKT